MGLSNSYAPPPPPPPPPLPPRPYSPSLPILLRNASDLVARSCVHLRPLHLHPLMFPDPSLSNSSVTSCSTTPSHTPQPHPGGQSALGGCWRGLGIWLSFSHMLPRYFSGRLSFPRVPPSSGPVLHLLQNSCPTHHSLGPPGH